MPTNSPSDTFINPHKAIVKRTYVVNEDDYELIASVFPERTFVSYFPGLCVRLLAESLRSKGIETIADRVIDGDIASPAAFALRFREAMERTFNHHKTNE